MKNFIRILRIAANYKGYAFLNIILNIIHVIANIFSLGMLIPVLDVLFKDEATFHEMVANPPASALSFDNAYDYLYYSLAQEILEHGKHEVLLVICVALISMTLLKNLTRYFAMFFLANIRNNTVRDLRNSIYHKILNLPLSYFSEERKGDIMAKASNDVQEVEWSIMTSLEAVFREPISIIGILFTLFYTSAELTLFIFILLPITGLVIGQLGKSLKKTSSKGQQKMGELLSMLEETLTGLRIIKAFNAEAKSEENFKENNQNYTRLMIRMYRKRDMASPLSEFLGVAVVGIVLLYGGRLVIDGELEASMFIGYLAIFSQIISPVKALSSASYHVQKGSASMDRINEILDAEVNITDPDQPKELKAFNDKIEYKNITFSYQEDPVIKDVSLTVEKGKTIALVGASGGGKSTLADLLPRFYDVQQGEILIDSINIKDITLSNLRSLMGIVTQESILFNDTVYNNIAFGLDNVPMDKVVEAAKIANAHEFIDQLKDGYQTNIGDRGSKLSGGQRQRLSIARAILKNPPILILDEATSALDTESEKLVQDALYKLMENRTSIVIAHRLSTIQHADEIIVLENGAIVERGTHSVLIEKSGVYKKLSDLQTFAG